MKIARARVHPIRLELANPITTARGVTRERLGALLELESDDGRVGWGEATPHPDVSIESPERARDALLEVAAGLVGSLLDDALARLASDDDAAKALPASVAAAVSTALLDLRARASGISIAALLDSQIPGPGAAPKIIHVNALIAGRSVDEVARQARSALANGYSCVKLKVGSNTLDVDLERVAMLRRELGPDPGIRLDANQAWDEATAINALERLATHRIDYVEQPVAAADISALARLRRTSPIAIAADEALHGEASARALLEAEAVDWMILKPSALGGVEVAARIAAAAREVGVGSVVTTLLDGAVGWGAAMQLSLHLARHASSAPPPAGLATSGLLRLDLAQTPPIRNGAISAPTSPGLGIAPEPSRLVELLDGTASQCPG